VGKEERVDVYLEVRKRRRHIFLVYILYCDFFWWKLIDRIF
jgi:hypothetical protein